MKVKFFITPVYPYGDDHYFHEIIGLAEGFISLGHEVFSNADYWFDPTTNQFLLKGSQSKDYDLAIYDYRYAKSFEHLLFRPKYQNFPQSAKHILVDRNDGLSPIWAADSKYFEAYDLILSGNLFKSKKYHRKLKAWAIGLTNRQMRQIDSSLDQVLEPRVGYNFRVGHNMRKLVFENLQRSELRFSLADLKTHGQLDQEIDGGNECDQLYNKQTTGRHHPRYFRTLNSSLFFLAFGGYMEYRPIIYRPYSLLNRFSRKRYYLQARFDKWMQRNSDLNYFIYQQDNFRFWESLYSNTCPISLDMDHWDYHLPEQPLNGEHYLGIKDLSCQSFVREINKLSVSEIETIGQSGRSFARRHYAPMAQAERVLEYLKNL